jgi:nitroreductase / dihydropteridine reductase
MNLIDTLKWRYATKRMNARKVSPEKINEIIDAIRLTASSGGLQPYKLLVIENQQVKKQLQDASFNVQVSESSHLLVFAAYEQITQTHIDEYINLMGEVRGVSPESLDDFKAKLTNYYLSLSKEESFNWAAKQAYIALGTGVIAAANLKVNATPMEGFDAHEFDRILGLKKKALKSVVLLALGYRDEEKDYLANKKKVRIPTEQFASVIA